MPILTATKTLATGKLAWRIGGASRANRRQKDEHPWEFAWRVGWRLTGALGGAWLALAIHGAAQTKCSWQANTAYRHL